MRHSTAHLLAAAVLDLFPGTKLGIGPALLDDPRYGFFYDVIAPQPLTEADLPVIEKRMRQIASRNLPYRRDEISKAEALRIFQERDEPLKRELIDEKAGETVSVYYIDNSPFIDFCLGPHVPNTNKLRAFKLLSLAGAYWKGDADEAADAAHLRHGFLHAGTTRRLAQATRRSREARPSSSGQGTRSVFDSGAIRAGLDLLASEGRRHSSEMEDYLREELEQRNYSLVFTPHIAKRELWQIQRTRSKTMLMSMFAPTDAGRN